MSSIDLEYWKHSPGLAHPDPNDVIPACSWFSWFSEWSGWYYIRDLIWSENEDEEKGFAK